MTGISTILTDHHARLVFKTSASRVPDLALVPAFTRVSHTSDLKIGNPVVTLPGTWHYRVSTGTG